MHIVTANTEKHRTVLAIYEVFADMIHKVDDALWKDGFFMDTYIIAPDGDMYLFDGNCVVLCDEEPDYVSVFDYHNSRNLVAAAVVHDAMDMYFQEHGLEDYTVKIMIYN